MRAAIDNSVMTTGDGASMRAASLRHALFAALPPCRRVPGGQPATRQVADDGIRAQDAARRGRPSGQ